MGPARPDSWGVDHEAAQRCQPKGASLMSCIGHDIGCPGTTKQLPCTASLTGCSLGILCSHTQKRTQGFVIIRLRFEHTRQLHQQLTHTCEGLCGVQVMDAVQSGCAANSRRGRVPTPKSQGVYDPIKNSWISPPQDSRIVEGLSYAPRGIFSTYGRTL